jgi:hypothetical protein
MNEHTKLELLKIAATLTAASSSNKHSNLVKTEFEQYCFYLFKNFDKLGSIEKITSEDQN